MEDFNPKQYRVGNIVNFLGEHKVIEGISLRKRPDVGYFEIEGFEHPQKGFHIKPIPLTEELLLKLGFSVCNIKLGTRRFYNIATFIVEITSNDYAVYYTRQKELICFVKHLHQLQNIYFSLTGEELKIK